MLPRITDINDNSNITKQLSRTSDRIKLIPCKCVKNINPQRPNALKRFKHIAVSTIKKASRGKEYDSILVLCIGSASALYRADNLGPLIGCILKQKPQIEGVYVYGTMENPLHAKNLKKEVEQIYKMHEKPFVIGVDLSVSKVRLKLGLTRFRLGQLKPGEGIDKELPALGDVCATATLIYQHKQDTIEDIFRKMFCIDKDIVKQTAEFMANGIYEALQEVITQGVILVENRK